MIKKECEMKILTQGNEKENKIEDLNLIATIN